MRTRRTRIPFRRLSWLTVLISLNVGLLVINLVAVWKTYGYEPPKPSLLDVFQNRPAPPQLIDYKDFISIMLSGLSLMITVLGIGLATIAIWGYGTIKDEARKAAGKIAAQEAKRVAIKTARDVAQATATRTMEADPDARPEESERINRLLQALMFGDKAQPDNEPPDAGNR